MTEQSEVLAQILNQQPAQRGLRLCGRSRSIYFLCPQLISSVLPSHVADR